jgi:propionyl-CoA carboxylase beta chain
MADTKQEREQAESQPDPDRSDQSAPAQATTVEQPPGEKTGGSGDEDRRHHTTAEKIERLHDLQQEAVAGGGPEAIKRQHARGKLTARERLELLLDPGSFVETDALARHRAGALGLDRIRPYGDGVVTGWGTIDGRKVFVYSQDFTVFGGSLGEVVAEKIC